MKIYINVQYFLKTSILGSAQAEVINRLYLKKFLRLIYFKFFYCG